jgi:hypothetical protein
MFSDTQFWRLIWKEYRVHRPLWLVLLVGTPLMQIFFLATFWLFKSGQGHFLTSDEIAIVFGVSFAASFIYVLGCGATTFSIEHESGNFDCQRVLPIRMPRVLLAKAGFALVSGMALTLLVWVLTRGIFGPEAHARVVGEWFGPLGLLYLFEVLAWSLCASLLVRQPLWSVVAAVCGHALMNYVVLAALTGAFEHQQFSPFQSTTTMVCWRIAVLASLCLADVVLGWLWFEDRLRLPRWRIRWKPDFAPSYLASAELPAYVGQRQAGWKRLLWLSWRDGRWLMAAGLAWYGYVFLTLRHPNDWEVLMLVELVVSFAFGLFTFAPEQWGGRFRFMTERGCWPRTAWLCRQVIWLLPILLMCAGTNRMAALYYQNRQPNPEHAAFSLMMASVAPWICFAAAQLGAMLIRSTAVSIAVGFGLTVMGCLWGGLMTSWLAPTWWAVGSLPVIALFVTWLKANDWVEERRDRIARWRTVLSLGIPVSLLLVSTATYRVVQIPVVTLPPEWDETPQVLARLTPAEQETLAIYRRALAEIEAGEDRVEMYAARSARLRKEHPDWTGSQIHVETFEGFHRDWSKQHAAVVTSLRDAHKRTPVPLALLGDEPAARSDEWNPDRTSKLPWLMYGQAEQSLHDGELDQAWDDIEIAFELQRRFDLRAALLKEPNTFGMGSVTEGYLLLTVRKWGRHKGQTRERVLKAIRKLEEIVLQPGDGRRKVHHDLLEAQSMLNGDERWKKLVAAGGRPPEAWAEELSYGWKLWTAFPWERWRAHRAVRLQAWLEMNRFDRLQTLMKWDMMIPVGSEAQMAAFAKRIEQLPQEDRLKLLAMNPLDHNNPNATMLRMTIMPRSLLWDRHTAAEYTLWPRADSFRATMLLLALADFHREHRRYPESLTELVPTYFAEIPRDARSAGPFRYFPQGVLEDVTRGSEEQGELQVVVRKGIPFLVTETGGSQNDWRKMPDGTWHFKGQLADAKELRAALRGHAIRVWPVEEP